MVEADTSDLNVIAMGLDLELKSIAFYEEHLKRTHDALEKDFLTHMIGEDRSHYTSLEDIQLFLKNPQSWYTEHEHHILDGA